MHSKFGNTIKNIYLCTVTYLMKLRHCSSKDESNNEDNGTVTPRISICRIDWSYAVANAYLLAEEVMLSLVIFTLYRLCDSHNSVLSSGLCYKGSFRLYPA